MTAPEPGDGWQRLHPLSPVLRGGRVLLALAAIIGQQQLRRDSGLSPAGAGLGALAVATAAVALGYLSWRRRAYRLTATELQVDSGVLSRTSRRVPLARLQAVEVVRPLVARVLGLAELRLEVVGGGSTEAPLAYLLEADAHRLRSRMLASADRVADVPADAPPEQVLVAVPTSSLVTSLLLSPALVLVPLLLVAAGVAFAVAPGPVSGGVATFAVFSVTLPTLAASARRLLGEYGFTVSAVDDGLRLTRGLLDTRASSIPAGRVQTVRISEPLLWRRRDWVRVEVDVAGYGSGRGAEALTTALLPVAPRALARDLLALVLTGPLPAASAPVPPRARWRAPLQHRRLRVGADDRHLVISSGVLTTTTLAVPLDKVQSLRLTSGPWQRRLGLATLHADTAGRRITGAAARHRDAAEAAALLDELAERARRARSGGETAGVHRAPTGQGA